LLLTLYVSQASSQTSDSLDYCVIVLNDSGLYMANTPVRIVSFKKSDGFIKNSITDISGTACFSLAYGRDYNVIIDDSAYSWFKKKITFNAGTKTLNDTIFLSPLITTTDVINVEAQKDFVHVEDDKIVYDISRMKIDPGPDALSLMKKIPMISVEGENVYLRGEQPKILVNGRESQIYGDLKSIPTDLIEKVEVMTVAPSKYEAEGSSGVINVILKKIDDAKYKVNLSGWGNTNNFANLNQGFTFKKNELSFFLNTSQRLYNPTNYSFSTTRNISTGELNVSSIDTSSNNNKSFRMNPGIIYDASKTLYFGVEGVWNFSKQNNNGQSYKEYSYLPGQIQQLLRNNNSNNNDYSLVAYINQQEITGKDELNLEFNLNNTKYDSDFDQTQVLNNVFSPFTNGFSNIRNNNYNIKFDYTKKFTDDLKLETGLKDTYKKEMNNYFSRDTSGVFASDYEFRQNIYSYYGTLSYNNKSIRIKPGLRIEYADMRGLVNAVSEFTNYQFDIFPSLTITKYLADNTQLQLTYGKRIERPRFNALNPFTIKRDIYNVTTGNPDLLPSYTHTFEFRVNKPIDKSYLNANIYFKHNTNLIQNFRYIDSIYSYSTYTNNGYSNDYGLDGSVQLNFGDFWNANLSGRVGKRIYSDDSLNLVSNRVSYNFNIYGGYSNPEIIDASLSMYYYKQSFSPLSIAEPFSSFSLNLSKGFFDRKLYVSFSLDDIFNKGTSENTYIRNGFEQYSRFEGTMGRSAMLSIRFTFGNYDEKRQKGGDIRGEDYGD
jgi:outer membrane receptor protein involved in Fe transport